MKKIIFSSFIAAGAICLMTTVGCKKNALDFDENDKSIAEESMVSNQVAGDFGSIGNDLLENGSTANFRTAAGCATVTKTGNGTDSTITAIFDGNVACKDGRVRSGEIKLTYSGNFNTPGFKAKLTLTNFKTDGKSISGTGNFTSKNVINLARTIQLDLNFLITEGTLSSTYNYGLFMVVPSDKKSFTIDSLTCIGTSTSNVGYTLKVTSPIIKKADCKWIGQGKIELTKSGNTTPRVLDFGDGTCDSKATITVGSLVKEIDLK